MKQSTFMAASLLALLLVLGCDTVGGRVPQDALDAPMADFSGEWFQLGGKFVVVLHQNGDHVTGTGHSTESQQTEKVSGTVKGRAVQGSHQTSGASAAREWAFILSEDGNTAKWVARVGQPVHESTYYRSTFGPSSRHPDCSREPSLSGGLVGYLPVNPGGIPSLPGATFSVRPVLATLQHVQDRKGDMAATLTLVPLKKPRSAVHLPVPTQVKGLQLEALRGARRSSPAFPKQAATVNGKKAWWVLSPDWSEGSEELLPDRILGELYFADPDSRALPAESVPVAIRNPNGSWEPRTTYLLSTTALVAARAVLEAKQPVRVETIEAQEPPLKDFLVIQETSVPRAKWHNRMLIDVKNKTLPKMLQEAKTSELSALVGQIEKVVLDVNHEGELAKDSAQKEIEAGRPPDYWRELAIAYRERIEVLKPILAAIKEEIATRGK